MWNQVQVKWAEQGSERFTFHDIPKGTDISLHSQAKLNAVARQLNERPRKTLACETPAERFKARVAATS